VIPKIIHQSAYANKNDWHPIWKICQQSVLKEFKDFEYKLWNDDTLDNFVKIKYPKFYKQYKSFPAHILQLDCVRYLLLHYYGGIYIDMDIYCYQNFYKDLKEGVNLPESNWNEIVQNSLMASPPKNNFWIQCFYLCCYRIKKNKININLKEIGMKKGSNENDESVKFITGPIMLSDVCLNFYNLYNIYILPKTIFSIDPFEYKKQLKTKHMQSGMWGREIKENFDIVRKNDGENVSLNDYYKNSYMFKNNINLDNFDFYKDYNVKE
jgi:hypothetical protein